MERRIVDHKSHYPPDWRLKARSRFNLRDRQRAAALIGLKLIKNGGKCPGETKPH